MGILPTVCRPVPSLDLAQRKLVLVADRYSSNATVDVKEVVISRIDARVPHLETQADVVTAGDNTVIHLQGVITALDPDIVAPGIHEGAIPKHRGPRVIAPVDPCIGIIAVVAQAVDHRGLARQFESIVPAVIRQAAIQNNVILTAGSVFAHIESVVNVVGFTAIEGEIMLAPMTQSKAIDVLSGIATGVRNTVVEYAIITISTTTWRSVKSVQVEVMHDDSIKFEIMGSIPGTNAVSDIVYHTIGNFYITRILEPYPVVIPVSNLKTNKFNVRLIHDDTVL